MICTDCIHKEVCGLEGYYDESLTTCTYKTELPHNTGYWIYIGNGHNGLHKCSECGGKRKMFDGLEKFCSYCGTRMVEPQKSEE